MSYSSFYTGRGDVNRLGKSCFDDAMFAYRTSLPSVLRSTSTCTGSAAGAGVSCAPSNLRTTIANDLPYLHQRWYYSSGGPVTPLTDDAFFPDTLALPVQYTADQLRILNKGDSMMSYDTRIFSAGHNELSETTGIFEKQMFPNKWRTDFTFMPSLGTNVNTRIAALNESSIKTECLRGQFPSYGSYNVIRAA